MLYASGNRDESVFGPTADVLDVKRPTSPTHVAFGFGEHNCLGAPLARLEGRARLRPTAARASRTTRWPSPVMDALDPRARRIAK